jgi:hypothetical protein
MVHQTVRILDSNFMDGCKMNIKMYQDPHSYQPLLEIDGVHLSLETIYDMKAMMGEERAILELTTTHNCTTEQFMELLAKFIEFISKLPRDEKGWLKAPLPA